jgi:hypothetical protein
MLYKCEAKLGGCNGLFFRRQSSLGLNLLNGLVGLDASLEVNQMAVVLQKKEK